MAHQADQGTPLHSLAMASIPAATTRRPEYIPGRIGDPYYVRVLDTTLRDGEQARGAAMTIDQKVAVARNLALLGVDVIDGGFPSASKNDLKALKIISEEIGNPSADGSAIGRHVPVISALARAKKTDIDTAWEAVREARRPRTTVFLSTSEIHMQHKLRKSRDEVVALASEMVAYARSIGFADICFAAEDATRFSARLTAGATVLLLADTVGCSLPSEIHSIVSHPRSHPGVENIIISVHCHNDLGLAAANTLAVRALSQSSHTFLISSSLSCVASSTTSRRGIEGGAREVGLPSTALGRAGNASFEEVENYTGLHLQPHKAIVGANAFCHESGIHQHITDDDLERLVCSKTSQSQPMWSLGCLQVTHGTIGFSTAAIKLISSEGKEKIACSVGKGPIDAVYKAIDSIVKLHQRKWGRHRLRGFQCPGLLKSSEQDATTTFQHIAPLKKANGLASIDISNGHTVSFINGNGEDTDFVVSSAQAYLKALNRTLTLKHGQS
ncbi:hypothetical protein HPP92_008750 [Vanilla planifolia]|uniref:2-isopropylmalate synthase n=1 Tax=Vanilla planifolia TaxID=51239 RepID=A0A835V7I5_VANPL|nr:hypothetical protein HPP92_008750 [Vanilla planifolia]